MLIWGAADGGIGHIEDLFNSVEIGITTRSQIPASATVCLRHVQIVAGVVEGVVSW